MKTNAAAHTWRTYLAWSAVFRAAGLSIYGLIIWFWLFWADGLAWGPFRSSRRRLSPRSPASRGTCLGPATRGGGGPRWIITGNRNRRSGGISPR